MMLKKNTPPAVRIVGFCVALVLVTACGGQTMAQESQLLGPEEFIGQVKQYHPVVKQAEILVERASASLLASRGGFDPEFKLDHDDKTFTGINYYRYASPEIKMPTITGITVKSGIENTGGAFANPERSKGIAGYIGVEVPLLNGLLIDKQRAVLQQAKIYKRQAAQERAGIVNDLLFDAYNAYWQWAAAYELYHVYSKYLDVARRRMNLVNIAFRNGDRSVADTIEAFSQLQQYRLMQNDAAILLNARRYELSLFLWNEKGEAYLPAEIYMPDISAFRSTRYLPALDMLEKQLLSSHPVLSAYRSKLEISEVDRKLKFQQRLPVVNVRANLLSRNYFENIAFGNGYPGNNYKFGFTIKTPLLLRQARGAYREARLKIKDNNWQLALKTRELRNKLNMYYNESALYEQQVKSAAAIRSNYETLLKIEEMKFAQGESSLFLVNSRESRLLETEQKIIELNVKYLKSYYAVSWSAGSLQ